jgi:hypothetical protein
LNPSYQVDSNTYSETIFLTWGSCSSPSGSLKSSSAPNFKMADNSSLLKGVELQRGKTKTLNINS